MLMVIRLHQCHLGEYVITEGLYPYPGKVYQMKYFIINLFLTFYPYSVMRFSISVYEFEIYFSNVSARLILPCYL